MKYYGYFTKQAAKALKDKRIVCKVDEENYAIYLCNSYMIFKVTPGDYDLIFRPVLGRDPGDWELRDGKTGPCSFDIKGMLEKSAQEATHKMERTPAFFGIDKPAAACIADDKSFAALYNPAYLGSVQFCDMFAASNKTPAVFKRDGEPIAMVLPVKISAEAERAVKALYTEQEAKPDENADTLCALEAMQAERDAESARADTLTNELVTLRAALEKSQAEAVELSQELEAVKQQLEREAAPVDRSRLAELVEAAAAEYKAERAAQDMTPAQKAVARVEALGLTATIKGAQTTSPVVWINGGQDRADDLKKAGAVWSGKRGAYYIRVA